MIVPGRVRSTALLSRRISSISRGSLSICAASSAARAEGVIPTRFTRRPSDLETTFWANTRISPSCKLMAGALQCAQDDRSQVIPRLEQRYPRQRRQ